jgi:hypothetical protein
LTELYLEYERIKNKYAAVQEQFAQALMEKERLFTRTLPSAIRYDKDKVQNSVDDNPLEDFVISAEEKELDGKISRFRTLLDDWRVLLEVKEAELRKSKDIFNIIYVMRYIDGYPVSRIAKLLHYNRQWIYKKIRIMWKSDKKRQTM